MTKVGLIVRPNMKIKNKNTKYVKHRFKHNFIYET